jgi:hypothetical protein
MSQATTTTSPGELRYDPTIVVERDYDGYFERRVRELVTHGTTYDVIHVEATPYLPDAVQYKIEIGEQREIFLTFYSGLRTGFGAIDWSMVTDLLQGPHASQDSIGHR